MASIQRDKPLPPFFGAAIDNLTDDTLTEIFADVPSHQFSFESLSGDGLPLVEVMVATKLAASRSAARRTIEQGGAYINNVRVSDLAYHITSADLAERTSLVLRSGKKVVCPRTIQMKSST